ncbi:hypothetical protein LSAT2_014963 [Lamellibrachia satsuma]|nr:hypothetical protein LSAT2_014963 [Lamellibrachia satsuma]
MAYKELAHFYTFVVFYELTYGLRKLLGTKLRPNTGKRLFWFRRESIQNETRQTILDRKVAFHNANKQEWFSNSGSVNIPLQLRSALVLS